MRSGATRKVLARALSIAGHPAIILPAAVIVQAIAIDATAQSTWGVIAASLAIAGSIVLYSLIQVRKGNWTHVDASIKGERVQLNLILAIILFVSGFGSALLGQPPVFTLGFFVVATMVALTLLLNRRLKVSLHTSFAMFASFLFWPSVAFVLGVMLLALAVGWSRLVLGRHTLSEVLVGALIGSIAGIALLVGPLVFTL